MIGQTISHYEILKKIGEGGMGEVFLAHDTSLDRKVALKFLPEHLQQDELARKRFLREAKAAAALDHPYICKIYEVGEEHAKSFISMEYVQGETLKEKLAKGPIPLKQALQRATEIAEALEAAHKHNFVHRDLKPSNIMLTPDGHVKVMDFGLAKQLFPAGDVESQEQTITASLTKTGATLGTLAYMSPEQLRGEEVDTRSDIFSFGIVLYEMLTGADPFLRPQPMETASAILKEDPSSLSRHLDDVPPLLQHTVRKMLAKEPDRRYQLIHDVRTDLEELKQESSSDRAISVLPAAARPTRRWVPVAVIGLGLMAIGMAVVLTLWIVRAPKSSSPAILTRLTSDTGLTFQPTLSADGRLVAYASDRAGEGNLDIWVQHVAGGEPMWLTDHKADDLEPSFSPDVSQIAFRSNRGGGGIYVIPTLGGDARLIAREGRRPRFSPDGNSIAYWVGNVYDLPCQMYVVTSTGGTPRELQAEFHIARYPVWSPDGKHLLFQGRPRRGEGYDWWVLPVDGGDAVRTGAFDVLRQEGLSAGQDLAPGSWLADPDRLIFSTQLGDSRDLWQIGISRQTGEVTGAFQPLVSGPGLKRHPSASADGCLVFSSLASNVDVWSLPVDANQGKIIGEMERLTTNAAVDWKPFLSADGTKVVFTSYRSGNRDIWIKDLETGKERAVTATPEWKTSNKAVSPDGSKVAYVAQENGKWPIYVAPTAEGVPEKLCGDCASGNGIHHWSPDGKKSFTGRAEPAAAWSVC